MNKKGFTGIETLLAIGILGLLIGLFAPKTVASIGDVFNGGTKDKTQQRYEMREKFPVGTLDEKGKFVRMGDYDKSEKRLNIIAEQPPEKWSTKVKIIIGFAIVLAIAFPTVATNMLIKARSNIRQIITGVEQAKINLPPSAVATLEANLSKKTNLDTKALVKKVKATIKADEITTPASDQATVIVPK